MFSRWKMKKCLSRTQKTFFAQSWAGSHSYLCQKTAFRPLSSKTTTKQTNNKNHAQRYPMFPTERKKVTTQFQFRCYYKKKRYPFWNTCLMFFLYTFLLMYDLAKLCSDKLCKSAFQKSLAKQRTETKNNETSIKVVTVRNMTKINCIGAVVSTARMELKADQQYFKTAPVITSSAPPSTIQITVTARRRCGSRTLLKKKIKTICLVV